MAKKNSTSCGNSKEELGNLICTIRKENGLTLRKFANAINLSPSNSSYI